MQILKVEDFAQVSNWGTCTSSADSGLDIFRFTQVSNLQGGLHYKLSVLEVSDFTQVSNLDFKQPLEFAVLEVSDFTQVSNFYSKNPRFGGVWFYIGLKPGGLYTRTPAEVWKYFVLHKSQTISDVNSPTRRVWRYLILYRSQTAARSILFAL